MNKSTISGQLGVIAVHGEVLLITRPVAEAEGEPTAIGALAPDQARILAELLWDAAYEVDNQTKVEH